MKIREENLDLGTEGGEETTNLGCIFEREGRGIRCGT
jgi:hypothetical protein